MAGPHGALRQGNRDARPSRSTGLGADSYVMNGPARPPARAEGH